jgi:hypothetical protein
MTHARLNALFALADQGWLTPADVMRIIATEGWPK